MKTTMQLPGSDLLNSYRTEKRDENDRLHAEGEPAVRHKRCAGEGEWQEFWIHGELISAGRLPL